MPRPSKAQEDALRRALADVLDEALGKGGFGWQDLDRWTHDLTTAMREAR